VTSQTEPVCRKRQVFLAAMRHDIVMAKNVSKADGMADAIKINLTLSP